MAGRGIVMIAIIDYGIGNVGSLRNMLSKIGAPAIVTSDPGTISGAGKIVLPGVGAFDPAMQRLEQLNLLPLLTKRVLEEGVPFLGVCLGMQLLTLGSEEGDLPGLGWIDAQTRRFDVDGASRGLPIPHMGWNSVRSKGRNSILAGQPQDARFYFVHSYFVDCHSDEDVLGTTIYGVRFASVIGRDNIIGVQFHPEKSHRFGMILLRAFAEA
jgi:glutamine amidotransferase